MTIDEMTQTVSTIGAITMCNMTKEHHDISVNGKTRHLMILMTKSMMTENLHFHRLTPKQKREMQSRSCNLLSWRHFFFFQNFGIKIIQKNLCFTTVKVKILLTQKWKRMKPLNKQVGVSREQTPGTDWRLLKPSKIIKSTKGSADLLEELIVSRGDVEGGGE